MPLNLFFPLLNKTHNNIIGIQNQMFCTLKKLKKIEVYRKIQIKCRVNVNDTDL